MRCLSLCVIICFFLTLNVQADEKLTAIQAVEEAIKEFKSANILNLTHPSEEVLQILYRAQQYNLNEFGDEFSPLPMDGSNAVLGPKKKGFIITLRQVLNQPDNMEFQSDGIALEQNSTFTLWNEKIYALMLSNGFLTISIAYNEDVDWELVADIEDEILYAIDSLRVNYNKY